jgi:hypothetical protein
MRIVQRVLSRREKIVSMVANLEALADRGGIDPEQYETLRREYEALQAAAESNVAEVREYLQAKEEPLRVERRRLQAEISQLDARQKVGELTEVQAERNRRKLEVQMEAAQRKLMRIEAALNARTSEDAGGYVDVEVRAPIVPGAGGLRDELETPEIVGAAQDSLKEWQGRAQELYETARTRGKDLLERDDFRSTTGKVRRLGERVKTWTDDKAELGAELINRQLEKRGREGISPYSLKIVLGLLLMLVLLFLLLSWDSYPKTPAAVLERLWETANAEQVNDLEQYLSVTTLDWMSQSLQTTSGADSMKGFLQESWAQKTHQHTVARLEILSEERRPESATIRYRVHYQDGQVSPPYTEHFVWEDGRWKVDSRLGQMY